MDSQKAAQKVRVPGFVGSSLVVCECLLEAGSFLSRHSGQDASVYAAAGNVTVQEKSCD